MIPFRGSDLLWLFLAVVFWVEDKIHDAWNWLVTGFSKGGK